MTTRRGFLTLLGAGVGTSTVVPTFPQPSPWRLALFPGRYADERRPYLDHPQVTSAEPMEGELYLQQYRGGAWRPYSFPKQGD